MASKLMDVFASKVIIKLELLEAVYVKYEKDAKDNGRTVEEELAIRLRRSVDFTADRPLYVPDAERRELEHILGGHLLKDAGQLVARVCASSKVKVADVEIEIDARLKERLKSRVFRGESIESVIKREVLLGLQRFCGMRP